MTTFSDTDVALAANAIGWTFFGDQSEDGQIVEVTDDQAAKCQEAAKRALEHIAKYHELEQVSEHEEEQPKSD